MPIKEWGKERFSLLMHYVHQLLTYGNIITTNIKKRLVIIKGFAYEDA